MSYSPFSLIRGQLGWSYGKVFKEHVLCTPRIKNSRWCSFCWEVLSFLDLALGMCYMQKVYCSYVPLLIKLDYASFVIIWSMMIKLLRRASSSWPHELPLRADPLRVNVGRFPRFYTDFLICVTCQKKNVQFGIRYWTSRDSHSDIMFTVFFFVEAIRNWPGFISHKSATVTPNG